MGKNISNFDLYDLATQAAQCAHQNCLASQQNASLSGASASAAADSAAEAAASAAEAAASAAVAGIYLGPFAVAPTTDNEGNPLQEGMLYFNTVSNVLFVWNGASWVSTDFNEFTNFTATGTTFARNLVTREADVVNVEDFGAVGDGATDDTVALQAMVSHVNSLNSAKVVFYGLYKTTQKLVFTCKNLTLDFEIKGRSGILCDNCDGIEIVHSSKYDNFSSKNLLLITNAVKIYTGLKYTNSLPTTGDQSVKTLYSPTFIGNDRYITGASNVQGWLTAIRLENADRFYIYSPLIQGPEQDRIIDFPVNTKGIYGTNCTHLVLHDPAIFIYETGVEIDGQSEAFEIFGGALVANRKSFNFNPTTIPSNDVNIRGVHMSSYEYNIKILGSTPATMMHNIDGCLLFSRTETIVSPNFKHIILQGQAQLSNNYFFTGASSPAPNHIGIELITPSILPTNARNTQILGNIFNRIATLVNIQSGVEDTVIANNTTRDDATTVLASPVIDNGTDTIIGLNYGDRNFGEINNPSGIFWSPINPPGLYVGTNKNLAFAATQAATTTENYIDVVAHSAGNYPWIRSRGSDTNIDLGLQPKGSGRIRMGTHSPITTETLSGYIEIKDFAGNIRKIAVVS